jgi:hypothetical protein
MNTNKVESKATVSDMDGCERCPECHILPIVKIDQPYFGAVAMVLECEQHGHMAMGDSLAQAVKHWNTYVRFFTEMIQAA